MLYKIKPTTRQFKVNSFFCRKWKRIDGFNWKSKSSPIIKITFKKL